MSLQNRNVRRGSRLSTLLLSVLLLAVSVVSARAATTLSIVIAGEPWNDPSISAVGTKLVVANRPKEGILNLGWSTTAPGTMGVSWQVKTTGATPAVVLSGKAPLPKAAVAGAEYWISISAAFLAATAPAKPQNFLITVTPFDAQQHANGAASAPVTVTQEADNTPPPSFGRAAIYPSVKKFMRYQEYVGTSGLGQLWSATGTLKLELTNTGEKPTDPILIQVKDANVLMRQQTPFPVPSLTHGQTFVVSLNVTAVLPQALSQTPDEQQIRDWKKEYQERGGVDLRVVMNYHGPESSAPMSGPNEVKVYKGSGDSCANGKLDGDEVMVPDCGGSCGCCFGRDIAKENWRSVYGYKFPNIPQFQTMAGAYDYGDIQGVFGDCSIYTLCVPALGFDPFTSAYLVTVKAFTGNGRCFGFAYSALSFINGDETLASYPSDGPTCDTWNLASPLNASNDPNVDLSPDLARMIKRKHLYQFTAEGLNEFLEARWKSSKDYWVPRLQKNLPAVLGITACAHAVTVHHFQENNDGSLELDLYDPDVPFAVNENAAQLANSTLIVKPDGTFNFDDKHVSCSGGSSANFTIFQYADLKNPSMPTADKLFVSFGGVSGEATITQVTDPAGRVLFRPDGTVNDDPKTRIRAFPFHPYDAPRTAPVRLIVADSRETFTHTIVPTGTYEVAFVAPSYAVQINQITGPAGLADQVTIDPKTAAFEIATKATQKSVRGQLVTRAADKSTRVAALRVSLSPNQSVRLEFDAQRDGVVYRHRGAASNVELELWSSLAPRARVQGRPVAVEDGDVLSINPNWAQIDQVEGVLRHVKRDGSVNELPLR